MIVIKDLMDYIYGVLINLAPTYFEDIDREIDGSINIDSIKIIYNIEGIFKVSNNRVRNNIPLVIDLWYPKEDIFSVDGIINDINNAISYKIISLNNGQKLKIIKSTNYLLNIKDPNYKIGRKRLNYNIVLYANH